MEIATLAPFCENSPFYYDSASSLYHLLPHCNKTWFINKTLFEKLFEHQAAGILWMWRLFINPLGEKSHLGGILGDDMGLGTRFKNMK